MWGPMLRCTDAGRAWLGIFEDAAMTTDLGPTWATMREKLAPNGLGGYDGAGGQVDNDAMAPPPPASRSACPIFSIVSQVALSRCDHRLGAHTKMVEEVTIDPEWFSKI